jgi:hypothetical protein
MREKRAVAALKAVGYRQARKQEKTKRLDEWVELTHYTRRHARRLLSQHGKKLWLNPNSHVTDDCPDGGSNQATIPMHGLYCLAIASAGLSLAPLFFPGKSTKRFLVDGRLSGAGWTTLIAVVSVAVAVIAGLMIGAKS